MTFQHRRWRHFFACISVHSTGTIWYSWWWRWWWCCIEPQAYMHKPSWLACTTIYTRSPQDIFWFTLDLRHLNFYPWNVNLTLDSVSVPNCYFWYMCGMLCFCQHTKQECCFSNVHPDLTVWFLCHMLLFGRYSPKTMNRDRAYVANIIQCVCCRDTTSCDWVCTYMGIHIHDSQHISCLAERQHVSASDIVCNPRS